jgi:uncharacterized membrane protein YhaH (DUF805 family)
MFLPYKRYADFTGRSRRMEYWMFALFYSLVMMVGLIAVIAASGPSYDAAGEAGSGAGMLIVGLLLFVFVLGSFIPGLAVQVRRLHDQNLSGWLVLINLVPYLGALVMLVLMCIKGTAGENQYGPDPLGAAPADVFA